MELKVISKMCHCHGPSYNLSVVVVIKGLCNMSHHFYGYFVYNFHISIPELLENQHHKDSKGDIAVCCLTQLLNRIMCSCIKSTDVTLEAKIL